MLICQISFFDAKEPPVIPPHFDFRRLKRIVSIEKVLASKGLLDLLRTQGTRLVGPCPIHRGDNLGAFTVNRERNIWRCFTQCDTGGDVVELARRFEGGSYRAAGTYLARLAGEATPSWRAAPKPPACPRPFRPFKRHLPLDSTACFLAHKGIHPEIARRFQVGAFYGHGMLAGCIAVRLFDPKGMPLGYAGRRLDPGMVRAHGKWKFPYGLPRNTLLYGYHNTLLLRGVVLVECPWGVLRLAQLGIPAVALLGTHLSPTQQDLLRDLPRIVTLMDGDKAGRNAATTIRQRLPNVTVIDLPDGTDPDDLADQELMEVWQHLLLF
jgi:DNA primase